jgi:hypothetical protein
LPAGGGFCAGSQAVESIRPKQASILWSCDLLHVKNLNQCSDAVCSRPVAELVGLVQLSKVFSDARGKGYLSANAIRSLSLAGIVVNWLVRR